MKSISSINEQIISQPEKTVEFFIAFCKARRKRKKLIEKEIPFVVDQNSLKTISLKPTDKELQKTDAVVKSLYQFGKRLSIAFPSYKQFRKDEIVKVLEEEILLFEISRRVLAKSENNLVPIGISLTNEIFSQMGMDEISEAFARQMLLIYLQTFKGSIDHLNKEITKPDAFKVNAHYFDRRYYYKEKGLLVPFGVDTSPNHFADYYLQNGGDILHCKTMKKEEVIEVIIYQSATIENQKLVTHKNTIKDTLYIPQSEAVSFLAGLYKRTTNVQFEISSGEEGISISAYIEAFHRYNAVDASELTDCCYIHFYRMIRGGFPTFSEEKVDIMTDFLCIQLGVQKLTNVHS